MKKMLVTGLMILSLGACQTNRSYAGRGVGTAAGAGAGALIGHAAGGRTAEGAAIGGLLGFLGGGMYDEEVNAQQQERQNMQTDMRMRRLEEENFRLRNDVETEKLRNQGWRQQQVYNPQTGQMETRWVPPTN